MCHEANLLCQETDGDGIQTEDEVRITPMNDSTHCRNRSLQAPKDAEELETPIDSIDKDLHEGLEVKSGGMIEQANGDDEEEEVCISVERLSGCWLTHKQEVEGSEAEVPEDEEVSFVNRVVLARR